MLKHQDQGNLYRKVLNLGLSFQRVRYMMEERGMVAETVESLHPDLQGGGRGQVIWGTS